MNFMSLFAGKMLGDGYMNKTHKSPRFCFLHALADKSYAEHCFNLFSKYIPYGANCKHEGGIYDKRTGKTYYRVYYQSKTTDELGCLYTLWYPEGHKSIPLEWLADNPEKDGLALWFQDDGSLKGDGTRIILSTESYKPEEIIFIRQLLRAKFNITAGVDLQNRLDVSTRSEVRKFQALVEPFICPGMVRKSMGPKFQAWQTDWQEYKKQNEGIFRTSVYIPFNLYNSISGQRYTKLLNNLLDSWMDLNWNNNVAYFDKLYEWITSNENIQRGRCLITPRFTLGIKGRLDLLSKATGFDRSALVTMALIQTN